MTELIGVSHIVVVYLGLQSLKYKRIPIYCLHINTYSPATNAYVRIERKPILKKEPLWKK